MAAGGEGRNGDAGGAVGQSDGGVEVAAIDLESIEPGGVPAEVMAALTVAVNVTAWP